MLILVFTCGFASADLMTVVGHVGRPRRRIDPVLRPGPPQAPQVPFEAARHDAAKYCGTSEPDVSSISLMRIITCSKPTPNLVS